MPFAGTSVRDVIQVNLRPHRILISRSRIRFIITWSGFFGRKLGAGNIDSLSRPLLSNIWYVISVYCVRSHFLNICRLYQPFSFASLIFATWSLTSPHSVVSQQLKPYIQFLSPIKPFLSPLQETDETTYNMPRDWGWNTRCPTNLAYSWGLRSLRQLRNW